MVTDGTTVWNKVTKPGVNRHIQYTLAFMCVKFHVNIFGSFLDIWQNAEWPLFLAHPVCTLWFKTAKTRNVWQSPTWGRPAPQFRVDYQFSYSKFLSQQRQLPNDPENCTLEPRGIWNCVRLQCTSTSGVSISVPIRFSFVDKSSPRRLENFGEDIPTSPKVIEAHTLNFKPNFKFSRLQFLRDPRQRWGMG